MAKDKTVTLDGAIKSIQDRFGRGSIMNLDDNSIDRNVKVIPSGILPLDLALGVGGVPRGRIIEVYGPESSGKTTVAMHIVSEAQKMGLRCAYIDSEHAFDPAYAESLGLDSSSLLFAQPDNLEEAFEIADTLVQTGEVGLIVFDSVAAMTPRAEVEGDFGEAHVGLQARLMSQALRKITGIASRSETTIIFINQLRSKIGVIYGSPEVTSGGNALKFYASVRLDVRRKETNKDKAGDSISNRVNVKVVKNKVAPPFKVAEFNIVFGEGADKVGALVNVATELGITVRAGAWYSYLGEQIGQGLEKTVAFLKENSDTLRSIQEDVQKVILEQHND